MTNRVCTTSYFRLCMSSIVLGLCVVPSSAQLIHEDHKLLANDGDAGDFFGHSMDVDNGTIVAGAQLTDTFGLNAGSAYLFDAFTGEQVAQLITGETRAGDNFGYSVAIDGNFVGVGARRNDEPTSSDPGFNGINTGAAYLFDATTGARIRKLLPIDFSQGDEFGACIAIDNGIVAIGAIYDDDNGEDSGSAYLFDAQSGEQLFKLLADDGVWLDEFGTAIDIHNGIVAVGAPRDDDQGSNSGAVYLFNTSTGEQLTKLVPNDGATHDRFGWTVAIENEIVVVGAFLDDDLGANSGSVYLFDAKTGSQIMKLLPDDGAANDWFGWSVAIDNGIVAAGAIGAVDATYLFDALTGEQVAKLTSSDGAQSADQFGRSVAIESSTVVIGAVRDDQNGAESGAGYVFTVPNSACLADFTGDGILDFFDVSVFLQAFGANAPAADFTDDGIWDFFDISAYLQAFATGCP